MSEINILNYPVCIQSWSSCCNSFILQGDSCFIITNKTVAPLYLDKLKKCFEHSQCDEFILPDGEKYKTLASYQTIIATLIQKSHQRSTTIVALGGGVVGDIAGFVASTYQRGVNFIQVPTTLLAQVDAAIGGKAALNVNNTKNMIGSFYQPSAVIIDPLVLSTLPAREFRSGLAEVIKHALIADENYFKWLEENIDDVLVLDEKALQQMIKRSIEIKANIVKQDEKDHGVRHVLNFGHTIGHAIEAASDYQLLHGEAVAIGMVEELKQSNNFPKETLARLKALLRKAKLPTEILQFSFLSPQLEVMKKYLLRDKKKTDDKVNLPILDNISQWEIKKLSLNSLFDTIEIVK